MVDLALVKRSAAVLTAPVSLPYGYSDRSAVRSFLILAVTMNESGFISV